MQWLRLYSEARVDRKLQSLSDAQFRVWFNLLCFANEQADRGRFTFEDMDLLAIEVAGGDVDLLTETVERLRKLRILSDDAETGEFRNFEKRQYDKPSDRPERVAERVRKHRETKKQADVTPSNAPYTDTDKDSDTDTEGAKAPNVASPKKAVSYPAEFEAFWGDYPSGHGSKKETFKRIQQLNPDAAMWAEIMAGLAAWHRSEKWINGFIKAAEVWVKEELWNNPAPPPRATPINGRHYGSKTTPLQETMSAIDEVFAVIYEAEGKQTA